MQATIETNRGTIVVELFDRDAPDTVANFVGLASGTKEWKDPKSGQKVKRPFYDGLKFHRVIENFMIQGGCPLGQGIGGPGYEIRCEINPNKHLAGSVSMAHCGKDTGGSQFFICHSPQPHLDGKHTVFGRVLQGMEVVNLIRQGDVMERVTIQNH